MTITAADLKIFASAYPLDQSYGGGRRSNVAILASENTLFGDVPTAFRASGGVNLRKLYPSVVSANAEPLMSAQAFLAAGPADAALDVALFAYGDESTTRAQAEIYLQASGFAPTGSGPTDGRAVAGNALQVSFATVNTPPLGAKVCVFPVNPSTGAARGSGVIVHGVSSSVSGSNTITTFGAAVTNGVDDPLTGYGWVLVQPTASSRLYSVSTTTAASGSNSVTVNRVEARVVPNITPYPTVVSGLARPELWATSFGRVPVFRVGEPVLISGGGNSEVAIVAGVDYRGTLTFAANLSRSYASGATVSSLLNLGDLQAVVGPSFSQQTWTKVFSDTLIGSPVTELYNRAAGTITTTNLGAVTERWAVVLSGTGANTIKLIGERLGQVATGSVTADFAPLNPLTNTPYFTIPAAGWSADRGIGNVLRFNTTGAYAPVWALRCVSPSAAGGLDGSTPNFMGSVNA